MSFKPEVDFEPEEGTKTSDDPSVWVGEDMRTFSHTIRPYVVHSQRAEWIVGATDEKPSLDWYAKHTGNVTYCPMIHAENMTLVICKFEPGATFEEPMGHYEELIYVQSGRMEYGDGRVLEAGSATINLRGQSHKGKITGDEPCVFLVIASNPMLDHHQDEFKVKARLEWEKLEWK